MAIPYDAGRWTARRREQLGMHPVIRRHSQLN